MQRKIFLFFSALLFCAQTVFASPEILSLLPGASVVGRGILSYLFWDVYEATLYAPNGRWDPNRPFFLEIKYYRPIKGLDIADRSIEEMEKQGFKNRRDLSQWRTQMKNIFPDVKEGSVLTAVYVPEKNETIFYSKTQMLGYIEGDKFSKAFFGIWLDKKTSQPTLRKSLLGLS